MIQTPLSPVDQPRAVPSEPGDQAMRPPAAPERCSRCKIEPALWIDDTGHLYFQCGGCRSAGPKHPRLSEALTLWNRHAVAIRDWNRGARGETWPEADKKFASATDDFDWRDYYKAQSAALFAGITGPPDTLRGDDRPRHPGWFRRLLRWRRKAKPFFRPTYKGQSLEDTLDGQMLYRAIRETLGSWRSSATTEAAR